MRVGGANMIVGGLMRTTQTTVGGADMRADLITELPHNYLLFLGDFNGEDLGGVQDSCQDVSPGGRVFQDLVLILL